MNKVLLATASGVLATSLFAGAALAKSDNGNGAEKKAENVIQTQTSAETKASNKKADSGASVTDSTYNANGHQGYKGLLNAIDHVQDKPAGAVIAELLLTKYENKLTDEQRTKLEAIQAKDEALSAVADLLEEQGSVSDAVYVQKDAVRANVKNIQAYKKLGKLYDKLGKKGVKLYVNGEEPSFEVAPFIREGSTLVPFRAIAEALKADVAWNEEERSVTVTRDGISVKLFIGSTTAYVDGKEVKLEVPAEIADGSTVVPVRFISEALKAAVNWEPDTTSVIINEE
ncbi:copper amine oxidase N-terminal domain-containing protein [Paenibacillus sp. 32352]|uniref:copper amine oxidase N-terminal domain-containing protein n=1 Tax=Paenibacillus sp. 32352 TaxID=1969111 RepID=UPI0009ACB367|nr:copper amine oxidase N-terminal domain-containing protein [Paenibacillus sp. 32352]